MYNIGKYRFYEISDSEDDICKEYASFISNIKGMNEIFNNQPVNKQAAAEIAAKSMYKEMVHSEVNKQAFVNMVNIKITERIAPVYEKHWLKFLGDKTYRLNPQIIRMDATAYANDNLIGYISNISNTMPDEIIQSFMSIHGTSYLMFSMRSGLKTLTGEPIFINKAIKDILIGEFPDSYSKGEFVYIKYAPSNDIQNILLLTRLLHTYL